MELLRSLFSSCGAGGDGADAARQVSTTASEEDHTGTLKAIRTCPMVTAAVAIWKRMGNLQDATCESDQSMAAAGRRSTHTGKSMVTRTLATVILDRWTVTKMDIDLTPEASEGTGGHRASDIRTGESILA